MTEPLKDFEPTGIQSIEPLHFVYPDVEGRQDPDFFDGVAAGFKYQWLPITYATQEYFTFAGQDYDEEFDFLQTVRDNDDYIYAEELSRAKNLEHYNFIKQSLIAIQNNRKMYDRAGAVSVGVAGVIDPLNIAFFHPVFNAGIKAAWGAKNAFGVAKESAKVGFAFGVGSELLRAPFDPYNTPQETLLNITGNTVFAGLLGGGARGVANRFNAIQRYYKNRKDPTKKQTVTTTDAKGKTKTETVTPEQNPNAFNADDMSKQFAGDTRLKEQTIDRVAFMNKLIPAQRIQIYGYGGKQIPDNIKKQHMQIAYNGSRPVEGQPIMSIEMMKNIHRDGITLEHELRKIYSSNLRKVEGTGQVMGIDYVTPMLKFKERFGKKPETFYINELTKEQKYPTPKEFEEEMINLNILVGDPKWKAQYYDGLPQFKKEAIARIEGFLKYYDQLAQDTGVFHNKASKEKALSNWQARIDELDDKIQFEKDPVYKQMLIINRKEVKDLLAFHEEYNPTRVGYRMPIYYDKARLQNDPQFSEELVQVFTNHFMEQTFVTQWTGKGYKTIPISNIQKARKYAEETVEKIKEYGDDPYGYQKPLAIGKSKHIMQRVTNIPEWKVRKFMIKDISVFTRYAEMMAFRSEYARQFGDETIDFILQMQEMELRKAGFGDKQIAEYKSDFLSDYMRVAGQMTRDPERMDTTFARISKKFAGMAYLTSAGITSLTETVGMPILEHGLGNVLTSIFRALDGNFDKMKANAKDLQHAMEGIDTQRTAVHTKFLNEMIRPNQIGRVEATADKMESFFYKFNGLALITMLGKLIDASIRIPKLYRQIRDYDSLDKFEIVELQRYGIDRKLAKEFLDNGAWQFTDTEMPLLNLDGWATSTKAERTLKQKMQTYLNSAARNTIIHATAFDRPTFADGFVFKKWKPYMKKLNIEPDPIASVGKQADGTYKYPIARIESGIMGFPFQFYNFSFAANQRITRAMFDPQKKYRLQGMMALMGMAYMTLAMRKPSWWFEEKDYPELITRLVDYSGIMGIYSDLAYKGVETAVAMGMHDPDTSWLKGRYKASGWDMAFGFAGATPSMYREWILAAHEILTDQTQEGVKRVSYNFPYLGLLGLDDDLRALGRSTY